MEFSTSKEKYLHAITINSNSGVGVMLTRTKEIYRCLSILDEWVNSDRTSLDGMYWWTASKGWNYYDIVGAVGHESGEKIKNYEGTVQIIPAIQKIDFESQQNLQQESNGTVPIQKNKLNVLLYPHKYVKDNMGLIQHIKDIAQHYSSIDTRLVILAPTGFVLPKELEDDIPIVDLDMPTKEELIEKYYYLLDDGILGEENNPSLDEDDVEYVCEACAGMTLDDFERYLSCSFGEICYQKKYVEKVKPHKVGEDGAEKYGPYIERENLLKWMMEKKTETVKRSEVLELTSSDDVKNLGGLDGLKEWLYTAKKCMTPEAREAGVDMPKSVLLAGVPGAGKSLAAKVIASIFERPLLRFDVSRVYHGIVGSSEERVRDALKMVEAMAPNVLFIDEADKMFSNGEKGDSGVSNRILGIFLTWIQENKSDVFIVMTCNKVGGMPAPLTRKGRMDAAFAFLLPNESERKEIARIHLNKRKEDANKFDLDLIVEKSEGFVAAEIENAIKEAKKFAFSNDKKLSTDMIIEQFGTMKPISEAMKDEFQEMKLWAENSAQNASLKLAEASKPKKRVVSTMKRSRKTKEV